MKTTLKILSVLILGAGFTALLGGCATDRAVVEQADQFNTTLDKAVIHDPQLESYFQRLGARIIAGAKAYDAEASKKDENKWMFSKDMQFHLVNSKTLNAFTTGGEHMYIYNELFQQAKTEDELVAVMSHEYAHVYRRHVQQGMNRQYAILGAAAAAGAAGYGLGGSEKGSEYAGLGAGIAAMAGQFVGMSYTRKDEAEADQYGFNFYTRAGWDPMKFGDFFQSMIEKGYDKGPEYLSDHPPLKSRLEAARQRAQNLPPGADRWRRPDVANASEFRQMQQRARELGARLPDDKSLQQTQKLLQALPRSCITPAIHEDQKRAEQEVLSAAEKQKKKERNPNARRNRERDRNQEVISSR
ncbi:MAG TPA: M48 family metalloprotease [Tepidisphaeraceae bacterium]|jgi:predicted Zn-dependent protease|nr:M48 family metalloprotease [Tepidisphaeraceae bacterium]